MDLLLPLDFGSMIQPFNLNGLTRCVTDLQQPKVERSDPICSTIQFVLVLLARAKSLQLMVMDICGPICSIHGFFYYFPFDN
uniref:Uncharacterized protein n=1 Tax=Nelumbo nucifera TaxID=4432 RepID=A0A822Z9Z9_NELNU|nr:TPA_asm: hypothetical protein HUJ06_001344 [Nelumbo nucifera]